MPIPTPSTGPLEVTGRDVGSTVDMNVDDVFLLRMGRGSGVSIQDRSVLQTVADPSLPPDAQGLYRGASPGDTKLVALGVPSFCDFELPCPGLPGFSPIELSVHVVEDTVRIEAPDDGDAPSAGDNGTDADPPDAEQFS